MKERTSVLFLFPYPSAGETFRFPALFACCSGELASRGVSSRVVEVFPETGGNDSPSASPGELEGLLRTASPRVVVLSDVFDPGLFTVVRNACDAVIVSTDMTLELPAGLVDFRVERFETNPGPLVRLVELLAGGGPVPDLPNVGVPGRSVPTAIEPCSEVPMFTADPDYRFLSVPAGAVRPSSRLSVYVNPGCPWAGDASANHAFDGVDLSGAGLARRGCSFCFQDGRYSGLDAARTVDRIVRELGLWLEVAPDCRDLVVWDESPWRFLPMLAEAVATTFARPMAICFHARTDDIIRHADRIEEACRAARRHPDSAVTLAVTLIGFENYSAAELARMNKGACAADVSGAVAQCRRIADAYPDVFEFDRFKASSFVLFTPWTTRADLVDNISGFYRDGILDFSTGMGLTKLRLYPNLPVHRLALRDGLVTDGRFERDMDSAARFGYSSEVPWRFADPEIDRVFRLYESLYQVVERHEQVDLLDWCVRTVFDGDGASTPAETLRDLFIRIGNAVRLLNGGHDRDGGRERQCGHDRSSGHDRNIAHDSHDPSPAGGPFRGAPASIDQPRRSGTLEITLSGSGVPGPDRMPDLSCDPAPGRLAVRISRYGRNASAVHVIGREPSRSPVFLRAVFLARQSGIPRATVRTDGLCFGEPALLAKAIKAGVTDIEMRVFGARAGSWTAVTGLQDGFDRFLRAASLVGASSSAVNSRALVELGLIRPEGIPEVVEMLSGSGLSNVSWEAPVAYLPVTGLSDFADGLESQAAARLTR